MWRARKCSDSFNLAVSTYVCLVAIWGSSRCTADHADPEDMFVFTDTTTFVTQFSDAACTENPVALQASWKWIRDANRFPGGRDERQFERVQVRDWNVELFCRPDLNDGFSDYQAKFDVTYFHPDGQYAAHLASNLPSFGRCYELSRSPPYNTYIRYDDCIQSVNWLTRDFSYSLSTGVIVGISLGVLAAFVLMVGFVVTWRRRRQAAASSAKARSQPAVAASLPPPAAAAEAAVLIHPFHPVDHEGRTLAVDPLVHGKEGVLNGTASTALPPGGVMVIGSPCSVMVVDAVPIVDVDAHLDRNSHQRSAEGQTTNQELNYGTSAIVPTTGTEGSIDTTGTTTTVFQDSAGKLCSHCGFVRAVTEGSFCSRCAQRV